MPIPSFLLQSVYEFKDLSQFNREAQNCSWLGMSEHLSIELNLKTRTLPAKLHPSLRPQTFPTALFTKFDFLMTAGVTLDYVCRRLCQWRIMQSGWPSHGASSSQQWVAPSPTRPSTHSSRCPAFLSYLDCSSILQYLTL